MVSLKTTPSSERKTSLATYYSTLSSFFEAVHERAVPNMHASRLTFQENLRLQCGVDVFLCNLFYYFHSSITDVMFKFSKDRFNFLILI